MQKIGFSLPGSFSKPMPEAIRLLKDVGFDAISPLWQRDRDLKQTADAAAGCGLTMQSLHAPFRGLPGMWSCEEENCAAILQDHLRAAEECAEYDIPVLVVHSWGGIHYTFRESELYFGNFDALVDCAYRKGIKIAFENLEGPEFLEALLKRYNDPERIGFCWDSGHERCYTPGIDYLKQYGHRLMVTHLNDNYGITTPDGSLLGTDDLHLLPFDGIEDWPQTMERLMQAKKQEILNFELKIRPKGDRCTTDLYSAIPLEQYIAMAYARASRAVSGYFEEK